MSERTRKELEQGRANIRDAIFAIAGRNWKKATEILENEYAWLTKRIENLDRVPVIIEPELSEEDKEGFARAGVNIS